MQQAQANVRLERHIDISGYGCENMIAGDINGDGRIELVFVQNVGMLTLDCFKPGSNSNYGKLYTTLEDQALDCLTAIDLQGRILWQRGESWKKTIPFRTHGGMAMLRADDINGDGRNELIRIKGDQLEIIDGLTGNTLSAASLGQQGYSSIYTAKLAPGKHKHFFVKPCSDGMQGHPYGCPTLLLDPQLKPVWGPVDFKHVGHTPLFFDVDGDGRDELLIGSQCVNPDGSVRWSLPLEKDHDDRRTIADIDDDGKFEQVLAFEGAGLVVTDMEGRIKWRRDSDHCGEAVVAKVLADRPGMQVLMNNESWRLNRQSKHSFGCLLLDSRGNEIWRTEHDLYAHPIDWRTSVGPQAFFAKPHAAAPPDARPFILDGAGNRIAEFDIPRRAPAVDRSQMPQSNVNFGDWGDYYAQEIIRTNDGPRILIWTRADLWIFKPQID